MVASRKSPARTTAPRRAPARSSSPRRDASKRRPPDADLAPPDSYWALSVRPFHILLFLLPLVGLYEIGSIFYLATDAHGTFQTIQAHKLLHDFFRLFGVASFFLPGIALLTTLLLWHILLGDSWTIRPPVLVGMALESAVLTLPLLVMGAIQSRAALAAPGLADTMPAIAPALAGADLHTLGWQARLTIALGAGLYEEMLFRLLLIAGLHLVLADLAQIRSDIASGIGVVVAALAFALYHDTTLPHGGIDYSALIFYIASGLYLGGIYVTRGFGITVAAHAYYDILVLIILRP